MLTPAAVSEPTARGACRARRRGRRVRGLAVARRGSGRRLPRRGRAAPGGDPAGGTGEGAWTCPGRWRRSLGALRDEDRRTAMARIVTIRRLDGLLAGIDHLVLKGPALAVQTTGDPTARGSGDVDLLVAPTDVEPALDRLLTAGWTCRAGSTVDRASWSWRHQPAPRQRALPRRPRRGRGPALAPGHHPGRRTGLRRVSGRGARTPTSGRSRSRPSPRPTPCTRPCGTAPATAGTPCAAWSTCTAWRATRAPGPPGRTGSTGPASAWSPRPPASHLVRRASAPPAPACPAPSRSRRARSTPGATPATRSAGTSPGRSPPATARATSSPPRSPRCSPAAGWRRSPSRPRHGRSRSGWGAARVVPSAGWGSLR
ncbi:hypothetical protein G5V59_21850 [Nocardioides sp. W3-2-3]|nr:hypothetical protein [Nocardioides convexus]